MFLWTVSCLCLKVGKCEYCAWEVKICPAEIFLGNLARSLVFCFFVCNKLAKTSVQIFFCRLFNKNKNSLWDCHTGCQQSLVVKATECVFFLSWFFFSSWSVTHFFSIGTDLPFIPHPLPADWEQQVHLWSEATQKSFRGKAGKH